MKFLLLGVVATLIVVGIERMGGLKLLKSPPQSPLVGRWDQVPEWSENRKEWIHQNDHGHIRFNPDGWFRCEFYREKLEGRYTPLPDNTIEFSVTYDVVDLRTKKKVKEETETWESKYVLEDDKLTLQFKGGYIMFKRAGSVPIPGTTPPTAPAVPLHRRFLAPAPIADGNTQA